MTQPKSSKTLAALTGALAALPGYGAQAGDTGYRYSFYKEANLGAAQSADGQSKRRYEIQTHQLQQGITLGEHWRLDADLMIESMSGASPWFVLPDNQGGAVQVMSGASIFEDRSALGATLSQDAGGDQRWSSRVGFSDEDDYTALSGGLQWEFDQHQRTRTWSAGLGLSQDELKPTDGGSAQYPERISSADKRSVQVLAGLSQVLNPSTVMQLGLSYGRDSGFLSDPYKLVFVDGQTEPDSRPDERNQWALSARLRHFWRRLGLALQLDWRHFRDDWDIHSDTLELGAMGRVQQRWRWNTRLRWYQQSQAAFYAPYFEQAPGDGLHSSDYRLSPYGAISLRAGLDYLSENWSLGLAYENYNSDGDFAPGRVRLENPGLVDFDIVSVAFVWHFGAGSAARLEPEPPPSEVEVIRPD